MVNRDFKVYFPFTGAVSLQAISTIAPLRIDTVMHSSVGIFATDNTGWVELEVLCLVTLSRAFDSCEAMLRS